MMKFSALALATGLAFSSSAFATVNSWDSTAPWGSSTIDYVEWNNFAFDSSSGNSYTDSTPDVAGNGSLTATGTPIITSTSNIYSWQENPISYNASFTASTSGVFDVYLRVAVAGLASSNVASLVGVGSATAVAIDGGTGTATGVGTFYQYNGTQFGMVDAEREYYFVWNDVSLTQGNTVSFTWTDPAAHISLDQLALATVAVAAVPEPSTYGMLALGLGVLAFAGRRSRKNNA